MRKLAIAVALSTTVLAGPALARDGAWYVGGDFGAMIVEDMDIAFAGTPPGTVSVGHDYGFDGALFVGYDFGSFRLEAEVAYKSADIEDVNSTLLLPGGAAPGLRAAGGGETTALSFMINAMLDFGDDDGLSGFIGGGAGVARVDFDNLRAFANQGAFLDDSDTRFAWQAVAGVRQAITPNIDVHLRYRFFNVEDVQGVGFAGRAVETRLRTHSLLGGITFNFGGTPPPPPCEAPNYLDANGVCVAPPPPPPVVVPVPPPPVEAPPPPRVIPGPIIVYFDWDRDELRPDARARLDEAIRIYQSGGVAQVTLAGHADRSGPDGYNVGLSQRRANNVRDYLAAGGVPAGAITTQAFGESRPAVDTADGVREPQNRRVEVSFGPGSGW
jgi:OmpA-OmpF porin, OOP family